MSVCRAGKSPKHRTMPYFHVSPLGSSTQNHRHSRLYRLYRLYRLNNDYAELQGGVQGYSFNRIYMINFCDSLSSNMPYSNLLP